MNTKKLKEKHKGDYEKFFMQNNLVISLPLLLNWSGDIFSNYKGINIKQKIPFRIYLGINIIKEQKIKFGKINYFDINEEKFLETNIFEYAPYFSKFHSYILQKYKNEINKKGGLEISILSETSRGLGLGFTSITKLLFFIGLEKTYKNINYINSDEILINDFLNINTPLDNLFRLSLELNAQNDDNVSIENQISSFFDSYYPVVSFLEDTGDNIKNINIKDIKIFGYRLNNLEDNLSSVPFLPVDYGLIYSGRPVLVDHIKNTNESSFNWTGDVKSKLGEYFGESINDTLPIRKPVFYKTFVSKPGDIFKDTYGKLMGAISLELLHIMTKLYSNSYTESTMRNFIDIINKIRYGNKITRKSSKTFGEFLDSIFKNFSSSARILGLAPNDTSVMGGNAVFAIPLEGLRKDLLLSIEKTEKNIPGVKLLYANWLDGLENKGFKINQDINNGKYSSFVNKNSIILINNFGISKIVDTDFLHNNTIPGLTLDLIKRKIYIDGEKLTSKEIHSQNATIDIIEILLNRLGEDISNKDLPKSGYSSNKNEMLGKIILPLLKLIETKKKIKFPLVCKGSIGEFYLKLKQSNLEINVIKNLS